MPDYVTNRLVESLSEHLDPDHRLVDSGILIERNGPAPRMERVEDLALDREGEGATGKVPARLLVPIERPRGVVVYVPGLGPSWATGGIEEYETVTRKLAERSGCSVLLVDWRRPPGSTYRDALDDVATALRWAEANSAELHSGSRDLVVAGDGLGALVASTLASGLGPPTGADVALQILICPVVDPFAARHGETEPSEDPLLSGETVTRTLASFVGDDVTSHPEVPSLASGDLGAAPPAVVVAAGADPLRGQAEAHARRLAESGRLVRYRCYPEQLHGFFNLVELPLGERALQDALAAIDIYLVRGVDGLRREAADQELVTT